MEKKLTIIHIEDNPYDADLTAIALKKAGLNMVVIVVESETEYLDALETCDPDLILCDHSLPGFDSLSAFKIKKEKLPGVPFILLTGSVSETFAVDCLHAGIDDYILKSNLIRLPSAIERVLSKRKVEVEKDVIEGLHMELQNVYQQIQRKNQETKDSINYAKRIQKGVLPGKTLLNKAFHKGCIIYKPYDIVSGDFYWLGTTVTTDNRDLNLRILATADCTGHGIPGAFLSMLTTAILNQTLKHPEINSPADVLRYLNRKLPEILNRNQKELIYDGLDIAFCAFDLEARILYFSGANRPVWIIRKKGKAFELIEHRGSKASIGLNTPEDYVFENTEIPLQAGDRVFTFTDGVTDQFGGPLGKKLTPKRLKEQLLISAELDFDEQHQFIDNFLENWTDGLDQVDDQLLIGIEIA